MSNRTAYQRVERAKAQVGAIIVGTSGWTYDGWRGEFYPVEVPKRAWLSWYATKFASTEINGSFYRTPSLEAVRSWRDQTPEGFQFAWKASKFITHWKRLNPDTSLNSIELMQTRLDVLGSKLGPVLFQLPARFKADSGRLRAFLDVLPSKYQYAFEFRDPSWYVASVFQVLADFDVALCVSDHRDAPAPWEVTGRQIYVRGHGPTGEYRDRYPIATLRKWAKRFDDWKRQGHAVYCYFDNDQKSAAPKDARRLQDLQRQVEK